MGNQPSDLCLGPPLTENTSRPTTVELRRAFNVFTYTQDATQLDAAFHAGIADLQSLAVAGNIDSSQVAPANELSLALLRAVRFSNPDHLFIVAAMSAGALVERNLSVPRTEAHARAVFDLVKSVLKSTPIDEQILHHLSPPLMAFFSNRLPLLAQLRAESGLNLEDITVLPLGMTREFLLMSVSETVLFGIVNLADGVVQLEYARQFRFTGLTSNRQLADFFTRSELADFGSLLEMNSWTFVRAGAPLNSFGTAHRVWREGIPSDVPKFEGVRVVLCFKGTISRSVSRTHTFPDVTLDAEVDGAPLTQDERTALMERFRNAEYEDYVAALNVQVGKGGNNAELEQHILEAKPSQSSQQ